MLLVKEIYLAKCVNCKPFNPLFQESSDTELCKRSIVFLLIQDYTLCNLRVVNNHNFSRTMMYIFRTSMLYDQWCYDWL